jgi:hypothetical protein
MVSAASQYDFSAVIDGFLAQKRLRGPHGALISDTVRSRARELLELPDMRYMPAFKILDVMATLVNIAAAIDEARQLRPGEVQALLRESLGEGTQLMRQFRMDAALERARYAPVMLHPQTGDTTPPREQLLRKRWSDMRSTHQEWVELPPAWLAVVDDTVDTVITSPVFANFRRGPLLQLFAEMLAVARTLYQQQAPLARLGEAIGQDSGLWKRYALKAKRYREPPTPLMDLATAPLPPHRMH